METGSSTGNGTSFGRSSGKRRKRSLPTLKALPDRVILSFAKPAEKVGSIIVPQTSQIRPEFGTIHDVGEGLTQETRTIAYKLKELQKNGVKIAVTFASGTGYMTDSQKQALPEKEWRWLSDLRSFRMTELAAFLEGEV